MRRVYPHQLLQCAMQTAYILRIVTVQGKCGATSHSAQQRKIGLIKLKQII